MEYSNFERLYRGPTGIKHIDDTVTISYFKNGYFLIFTSQFEDEKWYIDRFRDVMAHLDLNTDGGWIGCGTLVRSPEEFDLGLQQAYFASICSTQASAESGLSKYWSVQDPATQSGLSPPDVVYAPVFVSDTGEGGGWHR